MASFEQSIQDVINKNGSNEATLEALRGVIKKSSGRRIGGWGSKEAVNEYGRLIREYPAFSQSINASVGLKEKARLANFKNLQEYIDRQNINAKNINAKNINAKIQRKKSTPPSSKLIDKKADLQRKIKALQPKTVGFSKSPSIAYPQGPRLSKNNFSKNKFLSSLNLVNKSKDYLQRDEESLKNSISTLRTKQYRNKLSNPERIKLAGQSFVLSFIQAGVAFYELPKLLKKVAKDPSILKDLPSGVRKSGEEFGKLARESPEQATGAVLAEIAFQKGIAKVQEGITKSALEIASKTVAKDIKETPLGTKVIKDVKGVGDIEIIPPGKKPKLNINPEGVIEEFFDPGIVKKVPKLPKSSKIEKEIIEVVKKEGDIIGGSYSTEALLKKKFSRKHKDIDILSKNRIKLIKALRKKFGKKITIKKKFRSYQVFYKNKQIADIVKYGIGEEGLVKKYGYVEYKGLKLAKPQARLGGKLIQLGQGKRTRKVTKDIASLSSKKIDTKDPKIKGGFGYSKKELKELIGKKGPLTTALADEIVGRFFKKQKKLDRYLYVSPPTKSGGAQVRVSRLGIQKDKPLKLLDWMSEDISFKKSKPVIYVFPKEKLFPKGKISSKSKFVKTPKGFSIPEFSSELEAVLGKGYAIKRGKTLNRVKIENRLVPIIELKKVKLSKNTKKLIGERNKLISDLKKAKTKKKQNEIVKKLKTSGKKIKTKLEKETGFKYKNPSTAKKTKVKYVSPKKLVASTIGYGLRKVKKKRPISKSTYKNKSAPRPKARPSVRAKLKPYRRSPPRVPRRPPRPPRVPRRPPRPPRVPRRPPRPPRKPPIRPGASNRKRVRRTKSKSYGYNVYARPLKKSKSSKTPKLIKVNKGVLTKKRAEDLRNYVADTSLARTAQIKITKSKPSKSKINVPRGYAARTRKKFRTYRIIKGKRVKLTKGTVIEKNKRLLDTLQERKRISLKKRISQINKPSRNKVVRKLTKNQLSALKKGRKILRKKRGSKK